MGWILLKTKRGQAKMQSCPGKKLIWEMVKSFVGR
jgi:hypothetical protein